VAQDEMRDVGEACLCSHRLHRAEAGPQQRDQVRGEVPQPALVPAPGGVERITRPQCGSQPDRTPPGPSASGRDLGQPGPHVGLKPGGEEDNRRDVGLLHRVDEGIRIRCRNRHGLLQQQVLARSGCADGDQGLHVRRRREATASTLSMNSERSWHAAVITVGQLRRGVGVTAPDRGEIDAVCGGKRGRVRDLSPVAGANQAECQ
jgi:hypothetical protein